MYDSAADVVKCEVCVKADELKLFKAEKRSDDAFKYWDKGPYRFALHEKSANHRETIANLAAVSGGSSVASTLSAQLAEAQTVARDALTVIFTSLRYLACQNIAIPGHSHESGISSSWSDCVVKTSQV